LIDINCSRKVKITINGKEYERLEDVPEEFRTLLKNRIPHGFTAQQSKRTWRFAPFFKVAGVGELLDAVPVELPDGFQFDDDGRERRISWRWFSWHAMKGIIFAAIFSVPFDFVLYIWLNSPDKSWPAPALGMTLLFALFPAAIIYGWLAYIVNRTTIRLDTGHVSVRHGPLPWWGAKDVARADIDEVFSERVINDSDSSDGTIFQPREVYRVRLRFKNGKKRTLVTGLLDPDQALFIAQQIRK